jgi:hypothetical protein
MNRRVAIRTALLAWFVCGAVACARRSAETAPPVVLSADLAPLQRHFAAHRGAPQALLLLSPT